MERDAINGAYKRDEQLFLRTFSKQLADALRVKDEEEVKERERLRIASALNNSSSTLWRKDDETTLIERLHSTYVEICHDDPIITGGDEDCRRLAKALIPKQIKTNLPRNAKSKIGTTTLALSSRLVDGIIQATSRAVEKARTINNDDGANTEYMFGPSTVTTSEGYAQIAFAIFIEGPYRCIQQAENLDVASKFLGSFEPPLKVASHELSSDEKAPWMDKATANIVKGMAKLEVNSSSNQNPSSSIYEHGNASSSSSEFFLPNHINDANQSSNNDNDSMNEIYAEESDPDDYDYGTIDDPCDFIQTKLEKSKSIDEYDSQYEMNFNPLQLSESSQANQTFKGACKSIHYLLSIMSYSKLALGSLSSRTWSEEGMSETLADLSFLMLLEVTNKESHGSETKANSLFQLMLNNDEHTNIAALWDRPLLVLRDRALDKKHDHDALPSYLQLLTALLAQPLTKNCFPPTLMVGLSCLGEICSSKEMVNTESGQFCVSSVWSVCPREEVKKAIMTSLHSLARIVEDLCQREYVGNVESVQGTNPWIRTVVCIIPMIEYLTNLKARFDFQPVFEGVGSRKSTLSESDAHALSESGLFREMLFIFTKSNYEDGVSNLGSPKAKEVVRMQLLRTIFTLSVQSPEVLGRYALRVPDFAAEVHSSTFLDTHLVDAVLWLSMGSYLLENKSGQSYQPRLKLRTGSSTNATAPPKETKSLAERSINGFASLCETTSAVLQRLTQTFQISQGGTLSDEQEMEYAACKGALSSVIIFSNCLSTCPSMTRMWVESLNNNDGATAIAREQIVQLKSTLASLPSFPDEETKTYHLGPKKDDDIEGAPVEDSGIALYDDAGPKMLTMKQFRKEYKSVIGSVWSSVKVMSLALEYHSGSSLSKTD